MPMLGLGVYKSAPGEETQNAIKWGLDTGYRHIDTAQFYQNETDVGIAVRASGIPREQIFITTKLQISDFGYEETLSSFEQSLDRLGIDYIDLFLLHWPVVGKRQDSWRALEEIVKSGRCRAIGVSNFTIEHLEELQKNAKIVPAVNQVEFHPFLFQRELLQYCRQNEIQLEAYSPLTRGMKLTHPTLTQIAERYGKTTAQVLIRWCLQHNVVVIPKSVQKDRIQANARVFDFELSQDDMATLNGLNENLHLCWNPNDESQIRNYQ